MWHSRVEIGYYSVAHFDRVTAFKVPYLRTSVKGGAQMCCVNATTIDASRLSPALNGSSEIRCFERSDAIEIHDGIIFNFDTGLPHMYHWCLCKHVYTHIHITNTLLFLNRPFSVRCHFLLQCTSCSLINQQCWIARIFSQNVLYEVLR